MTLDHPLAASIANAVANAAATTTKAKTTGSSYGFLIIALVFGAFYLLVLRPRSQRQRQARANLPDLEVGAAVMSVGGIKGVVVGMDDTDVRVEVSPGVVLTFIRRAVNAQAAPASGAGVVGEDSGEDRPPRDDLRDDGASGLHGDRSGPTDGGHGGGSVAGDWDTLGREAPDDRPGTGTEGR